MIDLFMPFRAFLKFENVCTDNNVFRMHYKMTVIMLLVFTLLVTSKQFFGEPIHCMADTEKDSDKDAVNSYCWIYGTYSQVLAPKLRSFWRHAVERPPLCSASQHSQRKDLRDSLVLAHYSGFRFYFSRSVSYSRALASPPSLANDCWSTKICKEKYNFANREAFRLWRLVYSLLARKKHEPYHL